ncbi:MAG: PIG-L family deacetylase [Planctomycetaceae bacterium]|nr:PIG-L family deacetylase [Planctomycetaceae bacterium]
MFDGADEHALPATDGSTAVRSAVVERCFAYARARNGGGVAHGGQSVSARTGGGDAAGMRQTMGDGPHGLRPSRAFAALESPSAKSDPLSVIVFSPHPDDDVISMGGTLITLADQGHDVHVAYMTSGNIAVFDHDALRHIDYVSEFLELFGLQTAHSLSLEGHLRNAIARRKGANSTTRTSSRSTLVRQRKLFCGCDRGRPRREMPFSSTCPSIAPGRCGRTPSGRRTWTSSRGS